MRARYWVGGIALVTLAAAGVVVAQGPDDGAFADALWAELAEANLVGPDLIGAVPYPREGQAHGATLVTLLSTLTVDGITGRVIVKRSYNDASTREGIIADPGANLDNVTVMFQREDGYAPDAGNWYWAMYAPTGMVGEMEGMTVAGRVEMCTGCHVTAPGNDYTFLY